MFEWLAVAYPWIKALHIISVIAWMAGMLYLPRLYVYHCEAAPGTDESERFKTMERKLLRAIINPAMIATYLFGVGLLLTPGIVDWAAGWIYAKLAAIAALTAMHHVYSEWRKIFAADGARRRQVVYRVANEVPAVLMVVIVIMVVVRPF
jgi:putative membrane protein